MRIMMYEAIIKPIAGINFSPRFFLFLWASMRAVSHRHYPLRRLLAHALFVGCGRKKAPTNEAKQEELDLKKFGSFCQNADDSKQSGELDTNYPAEVRCGVVTQITHLGPKILETIVHASLQQIQCLGRTVSNRFEFCYTWLHTWIIRRFAAAVNRGYGSSKFRLDQP